MGLKFFADHCIPNYVIKFLRERGYIVYKLREYLPVESLDKVVLLKAQELNSILISLNGDFADIVKYPPFLYKGIITLQIKNHPETLPQIMNKLKEYLSLHKEMNHYKGKLVLVEPHRIRIRK
jgi:predicted nuclease of predicted toxin-antitoxin system